MQLCTFHLNSFVFTPHWVWYTSDRTIEDQDAQLQVNQCPAKLSSNMLACLHLKSHPQIYVQVKVIYSWLRACCWLWSGAPYILYSMKYVWHGVWYVECGMVWSKACYYLSMWLGLPGLGLSLTIHHVTFVDPGIIQMILQFNFYTNPFVKVNHLAIPTCTLPSSHHTTYCILLHLKQWKTNREKTNKQTNKQTITNKHNPTWNIFSATQISRVWTPPIPSAHSSHPPLWNQTWVTPVEHLWTFCCVGVALQRSIPGGNWHTTVIDNWSKDYKM